MLTMLLYVLIVGLVAALLFLVASAVFGRGEELGPLPEGTTATVLPAEGISGADVRALRFQQVVRGYKAGEVDWALARLAARIDELESQLSQARTDQPQPAATAAFGPATGSWTVPTAHHTGANSTVPRVQPPIPQVQPPLDRSAQIWASARIGHTAPPASGDTPEPPTPDGNAEPQSGATRREER